jgi:cytoskeletal protein RodZ
MSTFRNPVGPQSSKTYWRRRLVVVLGLVAVIVVIALIAFRPGSGKPTSNAADTEKTSTSAPASSAAATDPGAACAEGVVKVVPITDADSYGADQQPLLSLSITNTGTTACTFNAGSDVQEYVITSGEEKIWSSKDCQTAPVANAAVLEPGVAVTTTPFPWDRTRSASDTCESTDRPAVIAAGASYHLDVTINGVASTDTKQFILN